MININQVKATGTAPILAAADLPLFSVKIEYPTKGTCETVALTSLLHVFTGSEMLAGFMGILPDNVWYSLYLEGQEVTNWRRALKNTIDTDRILDSTRALVITGFQEALLWQDEELSDFSICDLSDTLDNDIISLVDSFIELLNIAQIEELTKDPSQFGQWLCLEQMGHGSGFYDSNNTIVSDISEELDQHELMRPADVYEVEGELYCDFFSYKKLGE